MSALSRIIGGHRYTADGPLYPSKAEAQRRAKQFRRQTGRRARVMELYGSYQIYVGGKSG